MCKPLMSAPASSTVLVVDDLPFNRKLLSALAHKLGFATKEAVNGAEALAMLAQHQLQQQQQQHVRVQPQCSTSSTYTTLAAAPSSNSLDHDYACILLDLQMPVLDGWSTARRLRALQGNLASLPIIACTACDLAEASTTHEGLSLEQQTLACGIDLCLNKPLKLEQLEAALQQLSVACPASSSAAASVSRSSSTGTVKLT